MCAEIPSQLKSEAKNIETPKTADQSRAAEWNLLARIKKKFVRHRLYRSTSSFDRLGLMTFD